jgi:hypothetical protein
MLDIKEELKNYKFIDFESSLKTKAETDSKLSSLLTTLTITYERIGKEQYKTASGIDDIYHKL